MRANWGAARVSRRRLGQAALAGALGGLGALAGCSKELDVEAVIGLAEGAPGVRTGPSDAPIAGRVLFDPLCIHCAKLWESCKALQPYMGIVWHPVGTSEQSVQLAAGLLVMSDFARAVEELHALAQAGVPGQSAWLAKAKQQAGERWTGKVDTVRKISHALFDMGVEGVPVVLRLSTERLPPAMRTGTAPAEHVAEFLGRPLPRTGKAPGAASNPGGAT